MPAKKVVDLTNSRARIANGQWQVTYIYLFFKRHQVIWVNGMPAESLYPSPRCLKQLGRKQRASLLETFPSIPLDGPKAAIVAIYGPTARPVSRSTIELRHC